MAMSEPRPCAPEWCESGTEPHDDECDNAPMPPMTKREFVDYQMAAAKHGIEAYRFLTEDLEDPADITIPTVDPFSDEQKVEMSVEEVEESAVCFVGIGSCGRGWCKHS
jgi:hypothetical protein